MNLQRITDDFPGNFLFDQLKELLDPLYGYYQFSVSLMIDLLRIKINLILC